VAKRLTTEDALALLPHLRAIESDADLLRELRPLLRHRSNFVIAKAAALAENRGLAQLAPELTEAFAYFMSDCVKRDPDCSAKLAIVNALSRIHEPMHGVFLAGVQHIQREPAWGGPIDTAATLRALCGRALLAFGHPDAFRWHTLLLADPEPMTRSLAVESLAGAPDERAELLLRGKIAREEGARDPEPGVEAYAFDALMKVAPETSFDFITRYLADDDPDRVHAAALALGASRHPDAFATLLRHWERTDDSDRELLSLAIALVRSDAAFAFLVEQLESAPEPLAVSIIEALAIFREDADRAQAVRRIVDKRSKPRLRQALARHFDAPAANAE
jgi:hypothetical protein